MDYNDFLMQREDSKLPVLYTENGVPVYTLYLGNIPQQKNKIIIRNYFSTFGEVRSVVIKKKPRNESKKNGFVTFEKPEFAAAALATNHSSISKRLKVRAADTCKQPMQMPTNIECDKVADNTSDDTISILDLNDDCLLHIFSYLNSVERLKLALICKQFNIVTEHLIKVNKKFDFSDMQKHFTLMETQKILSQFGSYIKMILLCPRKIPSNIIDIRYLELVPNYCQRLVELEFISCRNIHSETYLHLFLSAKNIKTLKLRNCAINNRICPLFVHLAQLECLNLSHNRQVTGKHLNKLKNIINLNLSNCKNLYSKYFIELCKSMQFKVLNIVGCRRLNDASFRHLAETQPNLERIIVSNSYYAIPVGDKGILNSLKHIRINGDYETYLDTNMLTEITKHLKEDLESLEFYNVFATYQQMNRELILEFKNLKKLCIVLDKFLKSAFLLEISRNCTQLEEINIAGSNYVQEDGVIGAVKNLIHLRKLNISFGAQFTDNLYHQIVKVLRDRKSTKLLTIRVPETGIKQTLTKGENYKKNADIVALTFETAEHYDRKCYRIVSLEDFDNDFNDDSVDDAIDYSIDDSGDDSDDRHGHYFEEAFNGAYNLFRW